VSVFKVSAFDPRLLRWWCQNRDKIDMDPPYQRKGRLWSRSDKAYLIDSILNEFDIPKFYVADFTFGVSPSASRKLPYAIVDGKQRFEAMFDFFDGRLTLDKSFNFLQQPKLSLGGLGYKDLSKNYPHIADIFDNFSPTVMRIVTSDEEKINELFVRLNRSKPLTGAEIRNALPGPIPEMIRAVNAHQFFSDYIRFSTTRSADQNAAAKLLLFEFQEGPVETKKKQLDEFAAMELQPDTRSQIELAGNRTVATLDRMCEIFLPRDDLLKTAGILPVYYWFIRQTSMEQDHKVREFLVEFESITRQAKMGEDPGWLLSASDLGRFELLNRSTNDARSHRGRVDLLLKAFGVYSQTT
jgi:hypothetical protein